MNLEKIEINYLKELNKDLNSQLLLLKKCFISNIIGREYNLVNVFEVILLSIANKFKEFSLCEISKPHCFIDSLEINELFTTHEMYFIDRENSLNELEDSFKSIYDLKLFQQVFEENKNYFTFLNLGVIYEKKEFIEKGLSWDSLGEFLGNSALEICSRNDIIRSFYLEKLSGSEKDYSKLKNNIQEAIEYYRKTKNPNVIHIVSKGIIGDKYSYNYYFKFCIEKRLFKKNKVNYKNYYQAECLNAIRDYILKQGNLEIKNSDYDLNRLNKKELFKLAKELKMTNVVYRSSKDFMKVAIKNFVENGRIISRELDLKECGRK